MNSRALLTVSMKILLMVTALILASAGSVSSRTTDLPHPWLTLDRSARVLSLQCKPPEDASRNWRAVYDLGLTAFLPQRSTSSNISLVTVTSNMKEPKVNDLFTIHRVAFQGSWRTVSVSLDFLFPVTDKELGRYYCTVHHSDKDDKLLTFTTEMVVNQDLVSSHVDVQPKNVNGFSVKVIEAHEVRVMWMKPESLKFTEASVSRMLVDEEGIPTAPSMSLFATNGVRQLEYNSDVLLAKFNPQDSGNLSITLYVKRYAHSQSYRYTCRVPYPTCTGYRADSCTCCQSATNPDTRACPTPPRDSQLFFVLFIIVLSLLLLCLTGVLAVYCVLKTRRRGSMANPLKSFITTGKSTPAESKEQHKSNPADSEIGTSVDSTHKHTGSKLKETGRGWDRTHKHTGSRLQEAGEGWDRTHKHTGSRLQETGEGWDRTHKHTGSRLQEAEEGWDRTHKHTGSRLQKAGEGWDRTHKHTGSRLQETGEGWDRTHKHTGSRPQEAEETSQLQTDLRGDRALATVRQDTTSFPGASTPVDVTSGFSSDRTSSGEETPSASSPTDPLIPGDSESSGGKENQQPKRVHLPPEGTSAGKGLEEPHESLETVHETLAAHQGDPMLPGNTYQPTQEKLEDRSLRSRPRYKSSPATFGEHTID